MQHLLGRPRSSRETDPTPVCEGSAQTQVTAHWDPGDRVSTGHMAEASQRQRHVFSSGRAGGTAWGNQTARRPGPLSAARPVLEVIRAALGPSGVCRYLRSVVDTPWTRPGWKVKPLLSIFPTLEGGSALRAGCLGPVRPALIGPCKRLKP